MREKIKNMNPIVSFLLAILTFFGLPFVTWTGLNEWGDSSYTQKGEFQLFVEATKKKLEESGKRIDQNEMDRLLREYAQLIILRDQLLKAKASPERVLNIENRLRIIEGRTRLLRERINDE